MKTKIIEHEYREVDEDGWVDEATLVAIKRPAASTTPPGEEPIFIDGRYWEINGTELKVYTAEAREYIKLFEKIIEAEESGD